ncbi:MAG TPA: hypothetical protein P5026_09790 [Kiritimatiellia bacterium]|nr:hypothetical protein [Kiritimatiellia bacterium]HRU69745.1 hypothetical protein [Kiritimatiellia bacterium]
MRRKYGVGLALLAATMAVGAELTALPTGGAGWFGNPLMWRFRQEQIECTTTNGQGIAVYEAAPLASTVTVEAIFTPQRAGNDGWAIAAVAIVADPENYWHLALVQTPPEHGLRPMVELCEMRDGVWLAQNNLKMEINETPERSWTFGQPHRLTLSMDENGVTGTILGPDGRLILRRRFAFTAAAVRAGRPALRVGGIAGAYREVRAAWSQPVTEQVAAQRQIPAFDVSNGVSDVRDEATGFFRVVKKPDGRWWAIDPLGRGLVLLGVDHVSFRGHWCEKLGYAPYGRKNKEKYADQAEWERETLDRLKKWGFNMLGAGCSPGLKHRGLIHTEFLNIGSHLATLGDEYDITPNEKRPCSAFPNVFHPDFEAYCRYVAHTRCQPHRDDPWLFGYFIDNELAWWGRGAKDTGLFDAVMKKGPEHSAKRALIALMSARFGGNIADFNAAFGVQMKSFDDLLGLDCLPHATDEAREAKLAFLVHVAERYFSVTARAIRAADPNHLVLGARFAGTDGAHPEVWKASGKYCDVVTFNVYPSADLDEGRVYTRLGEGGEPVPEHFQRFYDYVRRPMLITEWSFPALDAGLPSVHGAGQRFRTQAERTQATSLFARTMLSLPYLLGYDYFMWVDEPALGISTPFPEDSNYGLVTEDGVPYAQITAMFEELHREAAAWRFRPVPAPKAFTRTPPQPPLLVARRGRAGDIPATFTREGDAFRATNGCVVLSGRVGGRRMVESVTLEGVETSLGSYTAMLLTLSADGRSCWTDIHTVSAVEGRVEDGVAVIEIIGEGARGDERMRVAHRLYLPPGVPWFVAEAVSVSNAGPSPLQVKGFYFRLYSDFRKTPEKLPPRLWGMPPSGCWMEAENGRFFGAVAPMNAGLDVLFWINPQGGQHPDARLELKEAVTVAPGTSFAPSQPAYVIVLAGQGDSRVWLESAIRLVPLMQ